MDKTKIEWTDATWNPVTGCTKVSPGCDNCYAETFAERWRGTAGHPYENGFDLTLRPERLDQPLRWRKPRRIFVNSMSDLFHDAIPDEYIAHVFAVMALSGQHTFQVLTKRHARMRSLVRSRNFHNVVAENAPIYGRNPDLAQDYVTSHWPLPNVWLGVSVEDQKWADIRIPALLDTPAAVRWLSCEPLLGPVDLTNVAPGVRYANAGFTALSGSTRIDWVVAGGESGHGARPMEPTWARMLRDSCVRNGVPFLFKQWGEWAPTGQRGIGIGKHAVGRELLVGPPLDDMGHREVVRRVRKKTAGRLLDGRTWDEYPQAVPA